MQTGPNMDHTSDWLKELLSECLNNTSFHLLACQDQGVKQQMLVWDGLDRAVVVSVVCTGDVTNVYGAYLKERWSGGLQVQSLTKHLEIIHQNHVCRGTVMTHMWKKMLLWSGSRTSKSDQGDGCAHTGLSKQTTLVAHTCSEGVMWHCWSNGRLFKIMFVSTL